MERLPEEEIDENQAKLAELRVEERK